MSNPNDLEVLERRLQENLSFWQDYDGESDTRYKNEFVKILQDFCKFLRVHKSDSNLPKLIDRVDSALNHAICSCYSDEHPLFDSIPSFAHTEESFVADKSEANPMSESFAIG